jgi:hypothetical protein
MALLNFVNVSQYRSALIVVPRSMKSANNTPLLSQKTVAVSFLSPQSADQLSPHHGHWFAHF